MLRVGLTGGIGSGKTTVAAQFSRLGIPIIDTDIIARDLVAPGRPALHEIIDSFGAAILDDDGTLRRSVLRERIFADPRERSRLEAILHPRIRGETARIATTLDAPYCIVVIPLLFEAGFGDIVDRILVVDAPTELQISRVAARDGLDGEQVRRVMKAQIDRDSRLAGADDIVVNDGNIEVLRGKVTELHGRYLSLAADETRNP